jgi:hypothetical protein
MKEIEETGSKRLPGVDGRFVREHIDYELVGVPSRGITPITVGSGRPSEADALLVHDWWPA